VVGCRYFPPCPQLLSQPKIITATWLIPFYTAWWQWHKGASSLPKAMMCWCPARTQTCDLWITNLMSYQYRHHITAYAVTWLVLESHDWIIICCHWSVRHLCSTNSCSNLLLRLLLLPDWSAMHLNKILKQISSVYVHGSFHSGIEHRSKISFPTTQLLLNDHYRLICS